jgi:phospholipid transport system substrate-binding protein
LLLALTVLVLTQAPQESATDALKVRDAQIRKALPPSDAQPTAAEKAKLEDVITRIVDFQGMAIASLGRRYEGLTDAQRRKYQKAFAARFRHASESQIDYYRTTTITYGPEEPNGDDVNVPTTLTSKGEPTPVVYTMRKEASGWKMVDLTIDGVSTVDNYRSSFAKVMEKEGIEGLIRRLERDSTGTTTPKSMKD